MWQTCLIESQRTHMHQTSIVPKLSCVRIARKLTKLTIDRMISSKAKEPFVFDVQLKKWLRLHVDKLPQSRRNQDVQTTR